MVNLEDLLCVYNKIYIMQSLSNSVAWSTLTLWYDHLPLEHFQSSLQMILIRYTINL